MRVAYVCNEYPPRPHGGIGSFVQTLARAVAERGLEVTVVGLARSGVAASWGSRMTQMSNTTGRCAS